MQLADTFQDGGTITPKSGGEVRKYSSWPLLLRAYPIYLAVEGCNNHENKRKFDEKVLNVF